MPGPKLEIRKLTKTYTGRGKTWVRALDEVTLAVRDGETVGLIGPSGCGKSTLLDVIAGLILPDSGEVLLDGRTITGEKGHVGYMPQKDVLFPWRTVLENVILPLEVQGVKRRAALDEACPLLPVFGLEKYADSFPYVLSGGMRQRASFLRTYLSKKELMLLDEPFGKLDALTRLEMQQWVMKMWQKFRHTVLFVTHDVEEAILLSDRIFVISTTPGQITAEIEVTFPRPRSSALLADPAFAAVKTKLLHLLGGRCFDEGEPDV